MSYPMRLTSKKLVKTGCDSRQELLEHLEFWSGRYGFERAEDNEEDFVYRRGSHWHALYTFDIRKVPTKVSVRVLHDGPGACVCTMSCGSWFQFSTPGDVKRLSDEMDLLEACLKGAFSEREIPAQSEFALDRKSGPHDIQDRIGRGQ